MTSSHPVGTAPADAQPEHPTPGAMSLLEALDVLAKSAGYVLDTSAMDFKHDEVRAALFRLEDLRAAVAAMEGLERLGGSMGWCELSCERDAEGDSWGLVVDGRLYDTAYTPAEAVAAALAALGQGQQDAGE